MYRIIDWETHFENNRSKEIKALTWVPFPNRHDGDGYTALLDHPEGAAHYGAWCAIVQVASRCDVRGTLSRGAAGAHTAASLSRMTRIPVEIMAKAIDRLIREARWLEVIPDPVEAQQVTETPQADAVPPQADAVPPQATAVSRVRAEQNRTEQNGTEQNRMEENGKERAPEASDACECDTAADVFGQYCEASAKRGIVTPRTLTASRRAKLVTRLKSPQWRDALMEALSHLPLGGDWQPNFDWFIENDTNVWKVVEGKYDNWGRTAKAKETDPRGTMAAAERFLRSQGISPNGLH